MKKTDVVAFLLFTALTAFDVCTAASERKDIDVYWRDYNGTIPSDALPTGHDDVYIVQIIATKNCGNVPGSWYSIPQTAITMVSGTKITANSNFKILCTTEPHRFYWKKVNVDDFRGGILWSCLQGGYEYEPVYIGKIFHEVQWKIGKAFPNSSKWKGLNVWLERGGQYVASDFEILLYN